MNKGQKEKERFEEVYKGAFPEFWEFSQTHNDHPLAHKLGAEWGWAERTKVEKRMPTKFQRFRFLICRIRSRHMWRRDGGRPCPTGWSPMCSQTVYRCRICGEWDYGYKGGPAYEECSKCSMLIERRDI